MSHKTCDYCDKAVAITRCAACKTRLYCSQVCQTADWNQSGHGVQCKQLIGVELLPAAEKQIGASVTMAINLTTERNMGIYNQLIFAVKKGTNLALAKSDFASASRLNMVTDPLPSNVQVDTEQLDYYIAGIMNRGNAQDSVLNLSTLGLKYTVKIVAFVCQTYPGRYPTGIAGVAQPTGQRAEGAMQYRSQGFTSTDSLSSWVVVFPQGTQVNDKQKVSTLPITAYATGVDDVQLQQQGGGMSTSQFAPGGFGGAVQQQPKMDVFAPTQQQQPAFQQQSQFPQQQQQQFPQQQQQQFPQQQQRPGTVAAGGRTF